MTDMGYTVLAYTLGLSLLLGHSLIVLCRGKIDRRRRTQGESR